MIWYCKWHEVGVRFTCRVQMCRSRHVRGPNCRTRRCRHRLRWRWRWRWTWLCRGCRPSWRWIGHRNRPRTARWEEGVVVTTGHGSSESLAHIDDLLQCALVLGGRHVMVLAHTRRSLGLNRSYDIVLYRESSNIICNQFFVLQIQSEKRTAMAKFWSRTTGYVSDTLAASIGASGGTCTTRVRVLGRYHRR